MINIGGDANDVAYRYKMPKLLTKIEGRGNGIKTVIVNMVQIAKALHVLPSYPTKFFGFELGAQSKFNEATDRAIVNGSHNAPDLAAVLDKFIGKYILCPRCALPEIKHDIQVKKGRIEIDCAACGHNGDLNWNHRVVGFIFKDKDQRKKKKKDKKNKNKGKDGSSKNQVAVQRSEVKPRRKREETAWFTDSSKEAQQERKDKEFAELHGGKTKLTSSKESLKDETPANILRIFLETHEDPSIDAIASEVRRLQLARGLDDPQKVKVVLEALIDLSVPKNVPTEYKKHSKVLHRFARDRKSRALLIYCIEDQIGVLKPELISRMPMILQELYDTDVLDEESILAWADSPAEQSWLVPKDVAELARQKAGPFVEWLKEADEEGDEGDSD